LSYFVDAVKTRAEPRKICDGRFIEGADRKSPNTATTATTIANDSAQQKKVKSVCLKQHLIRAKQHLYQRPVQALL